MTSYFFEGAGSSSKGDFRSTMPKAGMPASEVEAKIAYARAHHSQLSLLLTICGTRRTIDETGAHCRLPFI